MRSYREIKQHPSLPWNFVTHGFLDPSAFPLKLTEVSTRVMGDQFLSSASAGGNCARSMRLPDPSPVLDKNRAPMGPEMLSSTGAGVWRKTPMAFPDSSSVLDKLQSARDTRANEAQPSVPKLPLWADFSFLRDPPAFLEVASV